MYPASFMPVLVMASAAPRTSAAVTLHAKWFQLFQPTGGVCAREDCARALEVEKNSKARVAARIRMLVLRPRRTVLTACADCRDAATFIAFLRRSCRATSRGIARRAGAQAT